jgi:DNA polymerase
MLTQDRALGPTFAYATIGWLDFETRSPTATPQTHGAYGYAVRADAIVAAWAIGDSQVKITAVADFTRPLAWSDMPPWFREHHARVVRGEALWASWNASFDKAIWNYATVGFPPLEARHIIDVMAQGTANGLASDLAMAARQAGGAKKDPRGRDLIKLFCLPRSACTPVSHPVEWQEFLDYAAGDIEAMRAVFKTTRQLSLAEWCEYWAMERVNERGVAIDCAMVQAAAALAAQDKVYSSQDIYTQTRGEATGVDYVQQLTNWLVRVLPAEGVRELLKREEEIDEDGVITRPAKYHLTRRQIERLLTYCAKAMNDVDIPADELVMLIRAQRVLQLRLYGGSKTPAKFSRMLTQQVDGILYGQYVFNGAPQTGRASSRGVQVHNLARDVLPYEHEAIEALLAGSDYRNFAILGDDTPVSRKLSLLIRPAFVPARADRVFVWSDWSQIEARILPWLVGDVLGAEQRLQIFRDVDADPSVPDLYTRTASDLSRLPIAEITKPLRQRGKVAELALGFGGGVGALQAMAASYGMFLGDVEAKQIVQDWREANPWCVEFWSDLWEAIDHALQLPKIPQPVGRLVYIYLPDLLGGSLLCRLPSGRCLTYRNIYKERVEVLDDDDNVIGHKTELRFSRGYGRVTMWHGMACENVVQAVAADCLRGTLRKLEGDVRRVVVDVRLHTHDEILCEVEDNLSEVARVMLRDIMREGFEWSEGLPLMSNETIAPYYTKQDIVEMSHEPA